MIAGGRHIDVGAERMRDSSSGWYIRTGNNFYNWGAAIEHIADRDITGSGVIIQVFYANCY